MRRALFELLWPAALKDHSADERPRRPILDQRSAGFPWELLNDRRPWMSDEAEFAPPSVRAGMVRQLLQTRFREDVVTTRGRPKRWSSEIRTARRPTCPTSRRPRKRPKPFAAALGGLPYVTLLAGAAAGPEQITRRLFTDAWEIITSRPMVCRTSWSPDQTEKRRGGPGLCSAAARCWTRQRWRRSSEPGDHFHQLLPPRRWADQP
jgi:hypothetical protein